MAKKPVKPDRSDYKDIIIELVDTLMKDIEAGRYHYDVYAECCGDIGYYIYVGNLNYTFPAKWEELDQVQNDMNDAIDSYQAGKGKKDTKACAWFYGDILLIDF